MSLGRGDDVDWDDVDWDADGADGGRLLLNDRIVRAEPRTCSDHHGKFRVGLAVTLHAHDAMDLLEKDGPKVNKARRITMASAGWL